MRTFPDRDLVVVGRTATHAEGTYFVNETHRDLLIGLAREFRSATYLCMARKADDGIPKKGAQIGKDILTVEPNWAWKRENPIGKIWSLRLDRQFLRNQQSGTVIYCYYPGFYSFLLSPTIHHNSAVSVAHFGSSAIETGQSAYGGALRGYIKRGLYERFQEYVIGNFDIVLCTGPGMAARYDQATLSKPILKFGSPIIPRSEGPCEDEPIKLLYVGAFRPLKGHEDLVETLAELRKNSTVEYELTLVGSGTTKPEIEAEVEDRGLANIVEFTGYISDEEELQRRYLESDVFVLPSLKEAVPWVLYEAALSKLPIVTTSVGGIPSFFENGEEAILVQPGEPSAIASGIERVVDDGALRTQLVQNARTLVSEYVEGDPVQQRIELISGVLESTQ